MSLDIGSLVGYVKLDPSGVGQGITQAQQMVARGSRQWEQTAGQAGEKAGKAAGGRLSGAFGTALKGIGATLVASFAVDKIVSYVKGTIDAASDLNETVSMSGQIFGDSAGQIEKWATTADTNLGLSKQAAMDAAASFGDMFLQLGFAGDQATKMSTSAVQMAADLGSFKNLDTADVVDRISAAFRGEYDSLQLVIPNINAARVQQVALTQTGKDSADALTAQEKATATLAIVQKDGSRAMGDFARTADSAANGAKIAAAQAENLKAKIGDQLLPAWQALIDFGNTKALPFLSDSIDYITMLADAVAPVAGGIADLAGGFSDLPGPVKGATTALGLFLLLRPRLERMGRRAVEPMRQSFARFRDEMRLQQALGSRVVGTYDGIGGAAKTNAAKVGTMSAALSVAKTRMGGLRGAGAGLMGALGGPWGLAIAAAAGAVAWYAKKNAEAEQRVQDLTDAIEADSGALGENSREAMFNALQKQGVIKAARDVGLSLETVTDAALGVPGAIDDVNHRMQQYADSTEAARSAGSAANVELGKSDKAFQKVNEAINGANKEVRQAKQNAKDHAEAMGEDAKATDKAGDSTQRFGEQTKDAGDKTKEMREEVRRLASQMQAYIEQAYTTRDANRAYEAAIDDATKSVKENGRTLDISTEKGRENQAALDQIAQTALTVAESNLKQGASFDRVSKQVRHARDDFIDMARKMGMSREAARKLADRLGLTRDNVDALRRATDKLPRVKHIDITVASQGALTGVQAIDRAIAALHDRHVTITVEQQNAFNKQAAMAGAIPGQAAGGPVIGPGTGTSDSVLRRLSNGEFVVRADGSNLDDAIAYYAQRGDRFTPAMATRLAASVGAQAGGSSRTDARTYVKHVGNVVAADPNAYLREMEAKARRQRLGDL